MPLCFRRVSPITSSIHHYKLKPQSVNMSTSSATITNITVFSFGPSFSPTRIDPSPACQKLLAFLSFHNVPYKINSSMKPSPVAQRLPWVKIELKDTKTGETSYKIVEDSQRVIETVCEIMKIDLEGHLTAEEKIQSDTLRYLVDFTLYPCLVRMLWVDSPSYIREAYRFPVPDFMVGLIINKVRKDQISYLNAHGNGDCSTEESYAIAATCYREIARVLGKKKFLFSNEKPSLMDFVVVRYFDKVLENDFIPEAVRQAFKENPQLNDYAKRLHATFFTDDEFAKRVKEGRIGQASAKQKTTKLISMLAAGACAVVAAVGFGVYQGLKSYNYI